MDSGGGGGGKHHRQVSVGVDETLVADSVALPPEVGRAAGARGMEARRGTKDKEDSAVFGGRRGARQSWRGRGKWWFWRRSKIRKEMRRRRETVGHMINLAKSK